MNYLKPTRPIAIIFFVIVFVMAWYFFTGCTSHKFVKFDCPEQKYWEQLKAGELTQDEYISLLKGCEDLK